jgi:ATP-dependent DNA ligase
VLRWPVEPMRAAAVADLPVPPRTSKVIYEPKWDGWRAIAHVGADGARLQSRAGRDLTAYFPDVCAVLEEHVPAGVVLDGELVSWDVERGRTAFTNLRRRVTAGRGLTREAARRPAHLVVFDLLQDRGRLLLDRPLSERRRRLERLLAMAPPQLQVCPQTDDEQVARAWFQDWVSTGIEGLVVKKVDSPYRPGKLGGGWVKVRARSTTEMVIGGITGTIAFPNSLLLGRYDRRGVLRYLTQTHPIKAAQRQDLAHLLRPMAFQGDGSGHPWPRPLPSAWSVDLTDRRPLPYLQVEPLLVAEIDVDVATDGPVNRQRHRSRHVRVRPELDPTDVETLS